LLVLSLMIPGLGLLFRFVVAERMGTIILSALVAHTGWHWMLERWDRLRQFRFEWPEFTLAASLRVLSWIMWMLFAAALIRAVWPRLRRRFGTLEFTHGKTLD